DPVTPARRDAAAHVDHRRASHLDGTRRRPHLRARPGTGRRVRHPRPAGGAQRPLRGDVPQAAAGRRAAGELMAHHDDDIVGKAYDSRLMQRLLGYLRPYRGYALLALTAIIANSMLQLAQPYLMKLAIDRFVPARDLAGVNRVALWYFLIIIASFCLEFTQTWLLQTTGQHIMFDMRMQIY